MPDINLWAVLVAAASSFVLGGLWYSPVVFLKAWSRESGFGDAPPKGGHPAKVFGIAFVFSLLSAFAFAILLGPRPDLKVAIHHGILIGFAFVAASFGINYQFANRSFKLWLIDGGYHVFQFLLYALVLGLWHG